MSQDPMQGTSIGEGTGKPERALVDVDGDGEIDMALYDDDGDGKVDRVIRAAE